MLLPDRTLLGHRLDSGRQTALLTGSGVLVENVAAGETVEDAGGLLEFFSSSGLVASGDELLDSLDGGAITGALSGEAEVVLDEGAGGALVPLGQALDELKKYEAVRKEQKKKN